MTNYFVFDTVNNPLYTQMTNTYTAPGIEGGAEGDAAKSGVLYVLTSGSTAVAANQNLLLQVTNPGGSGVSMYISSITGGSSAAATVTLYSGGTVTGGTTPTPFNALFGSSNTSAMAMTTRSVSSTITGSPTTFTTLLTAGSYFYLPYAGQLIVPPGRSITVSVGPGALTAAANITWWER